MGKFIVSACLAGVNCNYKGANSEDAFVVELVKQGLAILACPEQLGGLTTPRPPAEIKNGNVFTMEGVDVSGAFLRGANETLRLCQKYNCRRAILKSKSPSCGCGKIYNGNFDGTLTDGDGISAALLKKHGIQVSSEELNRFECRRLVIERMQVSDFAFIKELLNTEGFLKFIGDRNVRSDDDAKAYILKILENDTIQYWVVRVKPDLFSAGIVSFIKRDYLPHHDLGFAFLPEYVKRGFAHEATDALLQKINTFYYDKVILATTDETNFRSIRLLEKLGFAYQRQIEYGGKNLLVYEKAMPDLRETVE